MFGLSAGVIAAGVGGLALGAMSGKSAPDESGINNAAEQNAKISQEQLDFYKQMYADQAPLRQQASDTAQKVSDAQLAAMGVATQQAQHDADYRQSTFEPLEKSIVSDAENYDTADRESQAAGKAAADVQTAAAGARASGGRDLTRMGVNPNDGSYGAMERSTDTNVALGQADAMNRARTQVQTVGRAMKSDAANLGRGLASSQATQAGLAITGGNSAVGNAQVPLTVAQQGVNQMGQGYLGAVNANTASGNLYGTAAKIGLDAGSQNDALYGALGKAAGAYFAASDRKAKKGIKTSKPALSLAAIKRTPVHKWSYKPGEGDGGQHTGPMAQDVQKNFGNNTAPGGKVVDLISLNGHSMNAIKALDTRVAALEHGKRKKK